MYVEAIDLAEKCTKPHEKSARGFTTREQFEVTFTQKLFPSTAN